ncbi:phage terminase large subunit [bacterium]|nr:phage terminase large subunit [bacterium]
MASSGRLIRHARRLLGSGATPIPLRSDPLAGHDPHFDLFGGVAAGFNASADEVLLAGPAGTGKTLANLLRVYWTARTYPGARVLIARKTRESLTESVLVTWERDVLGPGHPILTTRPILRRVRQSYAFPNGSAVVVGGLDKPDKILSSEWDLVYVAEATELGLVDWETLGGRLRSGAVPYQRVVADCNPTTPHHWLYKRCRAGVCALVPTTHQDNPRFYDRAVGRWTPDGERYLARLGLMTGARRDRFLKGLWVAAEGVVYAYDAAVHLLPAGWEAPREWPRVWGIDWGKTAPTVLGVWAVDSEGRMYLVREVYQTRLRPDVLGRRAKGWVESGAEPPPRAIVCDHDTLRLGFQEQFEAASGLSLTLADKADRDKGIEECQARFDVQDDGKPRIFFADGCRDHEADRTLVDAGRPAAGVEELVGYVWDADSLRDEPVAENDHFCDEMRYVARWVGQNLGGLAGGNPYGADYSAAPDARLPAALRGW